MLMNAPVGVFKSTPEGRYLAANLTLARMYGYDSPEELISSVTDIARQESELLGQPKMDRVHSDFKELVVLERNLLPNRS